jgi:hypothetical protein
MIRNSAAAKTIADTIAAPSARLISRVWRI